MTKDHYERKAYRRSPGRQYGYDYDPLHSQRGGSSQSGRLDTSGERWSSRADSSSKPGIQLAQRPDPRRTRQLLRQSILAGKSRSAPLQEEETEQQDEMRAPDRYAPVDSDQKNHEEEEDSTLFSHRYRARNNRPAQPPVQAPEQHTGSADETLADDEWNEFEFVDPDVGYEDPMDRRLGHTSAPLLKSPAARPGTTDRRVSEEYQRSPRRREQEEYAEDDYGDEEDYVPARRRAKKQGLSRRKLLLGLGVVAAGGVAAYELGPKIPQAVQDVTANVEHQIQDAYNKGLAAGANAARKEIITALNNLEGYSLDAAINVARLTRLAYDAFVSPLITLAATVTGDFLSLTLQALQSARGFLSKFNQDNSTLAALQTVLETWVKQVHNVPQEWQTITDTDLDGAQGYLRALQRKIQDEQAKLNGQVTPTPPPKTPKTPGH